MTSPYSDSWALVIGINRYTMAPPLGYARNDAAAFGDLLINRFSFPTEHTTILLDADATASNIRGALAALADGHLTADARVVIFFAGHGYTRSVRRGEMGFLVPYDGDTANVATLVPWAELTRHADLIVAKHLLYVMDACYGGLAFTRTHTPGSMRFLRDMLKRHSRQVLTAGKADEVVADAGGPRAGHSVFTGHLLDALEGAASTAEGVLTANGVMSYVYDRVAKDPHSRQTPHYGHIDGDGDLVFAAPPLSTLPADATKEVDLLITTPTVLLSQTEEPNLKTIDLVKEYLSDTKNRIRLDDLVNEHLRRALSSLEPSRLPLDLQPINPEVVDRRLGQYESAVGELPAIATLIGKWGQKEHIPTLARIFARLADANVMSGGIEGWISLRWMPFDTLMYCAGIGALSADNYPLLASLYSVRSADRQSGTPADLAFRRAVEGLSRSTNDFLKLMPEHAQQYVPRSEYQFKHLQPMLDDLVFLGSSYEGLFDRFEVFHALTYVSTSTAGSRPWGPPGRFAWKQTNYGTSPLTTIREEALSAGSGWAPIEAGMFRGSAKHFEETIDKYLQVVAGFRWG